jgi:hypothetical protein
MTIFVSVFLVPLPSALHLVTFSVRTAASPGTEFVMRKEARRVWHRNLDTLDFSINWKLVEDPSTEKIEVEEGVWVGP